MITFTDCVNCGNETLFEINSTSGELTNVRKLVRSNFYNLKINCDFVGS